MTYSKGEMMESKMEVVFGITEENSKVNKGKQFVLDVVEILDKENKKCIINVYDNPELEAKNPVTTFLPTVVMNHVDKNKAVLVGTGMKFIAEYIGMQPFKDGKSHFGRKNFHNFAFFEAIEKKGK